MNGVRSTKACEVQNSPTLSVVNDDTTSGALGPPARNAWLILSSVMLPTAFTVMLGCFFSKAAMLSEMALTSFGALHPCQKVMVVLAFGLSLAPPPLDPVQAAVLRTRATAAAAAARWRWCRDADMRAPPAGRRSGGDREGGRGRQGVEDVLSGGGERRVQRAGQDRVVGYGGELDARSRDRQVGQLDTHDLGEPLAAGAQDAAGQHDEGRVQDGDHRGEPESHPLAELLEEPVAGTRCRERLGDGGLRRTGAQAHRPCQCQDLSAAGELLEAARVAAADVSDDGRAGQRQEADLARTAGGASVQAPVDDEGRAEALVRPQQHEVVDAR